MFWNDEESYDYDEIEQSYGPEYHLFKRYGMNKSESIYISDCKKAIEFSVELQKLGLLAYVVYKSPGFYWVVVTPSSSSKKED